ncbi:MAG: DoxX family protein [SAR324 cluster bacterium]|nr:DoxX family protein [SAR324 cluster bacterium]
MDRLSIALDQYKNFGIGLLRIATGLLLLQSGYTKFFVWKLPAVINSFEKMGIFLPQLSGPLVAGMELGGGALLAIGLFTRYLGLIFSVQFVVAAYTISVTLGKGLAGARLEIMLVVIFFVLATNGGGALNLGTLLRKGA